MPTPIVITLILVTLTALVIVNAVNLRQRQLRQLARQQQRLYGKLETVEDALEASLRAVEGLGVARQLNQEIIAITQDLCDLERHNKAPLQARLELANTRQQQLNTGNVQRQVNRLCHSDSEIHQLQSALAQASRFIHQRLASEVLANDQAQELIQQIDWARLQISVLSLIAAGYEARAAERLISALNYFQKAQDLLQGSRNPDPRRLEMVRQLSGIVRHERAFIDRDLFAEYDLAASEPDEPDPAAAGYRASTTGGEP
ncbi:hypothetical protein [Gilvimarinus algae]|uniref:DNA repair protein n=1 Tax=Gilvimarinus algae TaxID=3058037 RepID=A0ABT8TJG7_9GAMM|nr:hypothetical protein [Gilvimarinus sp. SDUM040014]MDO3384195.1 hypothetical protein [Gilvimarinus sp. SDUM040014]